MYRADQDVLEGGQEVCGVFEECAFAEQEGVLEVLRARARLCPGRGDEVLWGVECI